MASSGLAKFHETRRCAFGVTGCGAAPEISLASTNASASASSNDGRAGNAGCLLGAVITIADCAQRGREVGAEAGRLLVIDASLGGPVGLAALARAAATLCVSEATLPREGRSADGAEQRDASIARGTCSASVGERASVDPVSRGSEAGSGPPIQETVTRGRHTRQPNTARTRYTQHTNMLSRVREIETDREERERDVTTRERET